MFGLDYRKLPIWAKLVTDVNGKFRPSDLMTLESYPTTISDDIWPSAISEDLNSKRNWTELFELTEFIRLPTDISNACAVAFDVASQAIPHISAKGWFAPISKSDLPTEFDWRLCGFDVVDHWLQLSAIYGFSWDDDILRVTDNSELAFSATGVFEDEKSALLASRLFDKMAPEHSPFLPCGVWIGERPKF